MLECDVEIRRREFPVVAALAVAGGERVALFGPSGAGKTSVIEAIAGLVPVQRGRIALDGRALTIAGSVAVPVHQRRVGLVRQNQALFPHMSVRDNLRFGRPEGSGEAAFHRLGERLGLTALLGALPHALSGGQRQRVAFARTLLSDYRALLLDEPYTGLDAALRTTLAAVVTDAVAERGVPAVLVTHDLAEAQDFADRLVVIDRGRVLQQGAPDEVVARPVSRRVAELLGYRSFLSGRLIGRAAEECVGVHPERVQAGVRPGMGPALAGTVERARPHGGQWAVDVRVDGAEPLSAVLPEPAGVGERIALTLVDPPVFGPDGTARRRTREQAVQAGRGT